MLNQKENYKSYRIFLPIEIHKEFKKKAIDENTTMQKLSITLISDYVKRSKEKLEEILANAPVDDEPLTEDELKAIEEGEKAIKEGRVTPVKIPNKTTLKTIRDTDKNKNLVECKDINDMCKKLGI